MGGTLQENIQVLLECKQRAKDKSSKKRHFEGLLSVANYILNNGPLVKTKDAGEVYKNVKGLTANRTSSEMYEAFCKHLNISQVYLFGRAYLVHNTVASNIDTVVKSLKSTVDEEQVVKKVAAAKLGDLHLQYMDTPRDK